MATRNENQSPFRPLISPRWLIFVFGMLQSFSNARADETPTFHVLLIGCGEYDVDTKVAKTLIGPKNDLELAHRVLSTKFAELKPKFQVLARPKTHIEGVACSDPSYENIKTALEQLSARMNKGDKAFVMFCGHGAYQPNFNQDDWEVDGLDEVFLPVDFKTAWDESRDSFVNALSDDEIRIALQNIAAKEKTSVCVFFDSCHSATAARAGVRSRSVSDEGGLMAYLPESVKKRWEQLRAKPPVKKESHTSRLPPNVVAFYATSPGQAAPEGNMPPRTSNQSTYGYYSYAFFQALNAAQESISPDELNRLVCSTYGLWGLTEPTPMVEGNGKYLGFLDSAKIERSRIALNKSLIIDAGELASVYEGTVLAVYPKIPGQNQKPIGYVKVKTDGGGILSSEVTTAKWPEDGPLEHPAVPAELLKDGGRCEVASYNIGAARVQVAVKSVVDNGQESLTLMQLKTDLTEIAKGDLAKFAVVEEVANADWTAWVDGDKVFLVNVGELSPSGTLKTEGSYRRYEPTADDKTTDWITNQLETIARFKNLLKVADMIQLASKKRDPEDVQPEDVQFEVGFRDHQSEDDWTGTLREKIPEEVFLGGRFSFEITNKTRGAIDVSILYLDADYGISAYFPESRSAGDNRLKSENSKINIQNGMQRSLVNEVGPHLGRDRILIFVTKVPVDREVTTPIDFTVFAQESLKDAGDLARSRGTNALGTALGELLAEVTYRNGSRSIRSRELKEVSARIIEWNVRERVADSSLERTESTRDGME